MASLRPSSHRSGSYRSSSRREDETLRPQLHGPHSRSRSCSRSPQTYLPGTPSQRIPNTSRRRKPPQSPKVEDAAISMSKEVSKEYKPILVDLEDDGVQMRGKPNQQPVIIPTDSDSDEMSSQAPNESSGGVTPSSSEDDNHIPPSSRNRLDPACDKDWERRHIPKLNTNFSKYSSPAEAPRVERERSPYVYTPRESRPKDPRFSEEHLPSPDTLSPRIPSIAGQISHSQLPSQRVASATEPQLKDSRFYEKNSLPREPLSPNVDSARNPRSRSQRLSHNSQDDKFTHSRGEKSVLEQPKRPSLDRYATAMASMGGLPCTGASSPPSRHYPSSSDESEKDLAAIRQFGQLSLESKAQKATSYFDNPRPNERRHSSKNPTAPIRTPVATEATQTPPLNRHSLLSGPAAIESILAGLGGERKASPRPSPQPSPTSSPYPSPPKTPPVESYQRPPHPLSGLKHDSPNSKASSTLSSAPSSPKTPGPSAMSRHSDRDARSRRPSARSRATSPVPLPRLEESAPSYLPKIDIREPSPANHARSFSYDAGGSLSQSSARNPSTPPNVPTSSSLKPTVFDRRQRSMSDAASRGSRPRLTVNPQPMQTGTDSQQSSGIRQRPSSPNPGASNHSSSSLFFEQAPSEHRSRSVRPDHNPLSSYPRPSMPDPSPNSDKSTSSAHNSRGPDSGLSPTAYNTGSRRRSRSSAPTPQLAVSDQPTPGGLPVCTGPDRLAGHDEWYSLEQYPSFAICNKCRFKIFGAGYERHFVPRSPAKQCDLNDPWMRIAVLLAFKEKRVDVDRLAKLAKISKHKDPCPKGTPEYRDWYRLYDSEAKCVLPDFGVCSHCVYSLETLFPALEETFYRDRRSHQHEEAARPCSLRSDVERFGAYIDKMADAAERAERQHQHPDMSDFIWEHKWKTVISDCTKDQLLSGQDWHIHQNMPEVFVCEACYYTEVRPAIKKNVTVALPFTRVSQPIEAAVSCQLYSPRMKQIFKEACEDDDDEASDDLRHAVTRRQRLQHDLQAARQQWQRHPRDEKIHGELEELIRRWQKLEKAK